MMHYIVPDSDSIHTLEAQEQMHIFGGLFRDVISLLFQTDILVEINHFKEKFYPWFPIEAKFHQ